MISPQKMTPRGDTPLQPLREVGSGEKTQFWDMEDFMQALRIASRRGGIPASGLFNHPEEAEILRHTR